VAYEELIAEATLLSTVPTGVPEYRFMQSCFYNGKTLITNRQDLEFYIYIGSKLFRSPLGSKEPSHAY
jgi:hypothetical protein